MPKITRIAILTLAILLTFGVSAALGANHDFEGGGTGEWNELSVFSPWEGTLDSASNNFTGFWGNDPLNYIRGNTSYDQQSGKFIVGGITSNGYWQYQSTTYGKWEGYFKPSSPDTAEGTWWPDSDPDYEDGTWFGAL